MEILQSFDGPNAQIILIIILVYIILLWISVLIWAARDVFRRSDNLIFQTFTIFLNLIPPPLGILLYLMIRPHQTNAQRYYEQMEHKLLSETAEEEISHCPQCESIASKTHMFCHNCGKKLKTTCPKCKESFAIDWPHCPECGKKRATKKGVEEENEE